MPVVQHMLPQGFRLGDVEVRPEQGHHQAAKQPCQPRCQGTLAGLVQTGILAATWQGGQGLARLTQPTLYWWGVLKGPILRAEA